jgi:ABC-type dipeptide/oligopeptide/nickel transport system permease component
VLRYILGRIAGLAFVLFAVSVITFTLMRSVPGGPFDLGEQPVSASTQRALEEKYGLGGPIWEQYLRYMGNALQGDFGVPFQAPNLTVTELIMDAWPVTVAIGIPTILVAYIFGTILGVIAAVKQNSVLDYVVSFFATLGLVVPSFVIAIWLILIFSVQLKWLPAGGWTGDFGRPQEYILPVIAYSLTPTALVARYTRASLVETLRADYVRTARAKGLAERFVLLRHAGRNALIPCVTVLLPEIPNILTGSIFIEAAFRIPGLGRFFVTSTFTRDYPMIMALVLLIATLWGITYLLTDILYTFLDPRIRFGN